MHIPFVDLGLQHQQIEEELQKLLAGIFTKASFILGEEVLAFEDQFARFSNVKHCIGVGSGTDALDLILRAIDIRPGDEVIVPVNSFIASALSVVRAGGTPVLVDADPEYMLIDVEQAVDRIGPATKAIMPVHLYGQMAPLSELADAAAGRGLALVEDAAQAHGSTQMGVGPATAGVAAGVSFYPGKNLGAYGDAGAVITNVDEVAERIQRLRNWGSSVKYEHPELGFNSRMDTLQAAVLLAKLPLLNDWNKSRRQAAERYSELLADIEGVTTPSVMPGNEHVWHLYVIRIPERDRVFRDLEEAGVQAGVHYPTPMHLQGALSFLGHKRGDFPIAEQLAGEILSLPMFPGITEEQQERVVEALQEALKEH